MPSYGFWECHALAKLDQEKRIVTDTLQVSDDLQGPNASASKREEEGSGEKTICRWIHKAYSTICVGKKMQIHRTITFYYAHIEW